jgi:hypothetical protein
VSLIHAVHDRVHSFDHRPFQPSLCGGCLLCVALDDHLVVADEDRPGLRTLVTALPQEGQGQLQAIGCGTLNRRV